MRRNQISLKAQCGDKGTCGTCTVETDQKTLDRSESEKQVLTANGYNPTTAALSCQHSQTEFSGANVVIPKQPTLRW